MTSRGSFPGIQLHILFTAAIVTALCSTQVLSSGLDLLKANYEASTFPAFVFSQLRSQNEIVRPKICGRPADSRLRWAATTPRIARDGAFLCGLERHMEASQYNVKTRRRTNFQGAQCVINVERTQGNLAETIADLIGKGQVAVEVREAKYGEGDSVALLRCRAFSQGKDVFRAQLLKMVHGGSVSQGSHLVIGGKTRTTFLVAAALVSGQEKSLALNLMLSDLDQLLTDGWISRMEYSARKKRLLAETLNDDPTEVIVGSVDCAVHEFVGQDLSIAKAVYISSMAVREGFRRRGVGARLLKGAEKLAREMRGVNDLFLHVEEHNLAALRLYGSAGFHRADVNHTGTAYMDRTLRFILHVPVKAQLYYANLR